MIQTYLPNFGIPATAGYCLKYIDDAGNAPSRTASAKIAADNERAAGRLSAAIDSPVGVWVVGFLEFTTGSYVYGDVRYYLKDLGHVFFMKHLGGGKYEIRDSEVGSRQRGVYGSLAEIVAWFGAYKPKYIGWSTHCDGRQYAKEEEMAEKVDLGTGRILLHGVVGRNGINGRPNALDGVCDEEIDKYHVGQALTPEYLMSIFESPEAKDWRDNPDNPSSIPTVNHRAVYFPQVYAQLVQTLGQLDDLKKSETLPSEAEETLEELRKVLRKLDV